MDSASQKLQDTVQQFTNYLLMVTAFLLPGFFLTFTSDWYETNKQFLLLGITALGLVLWTLRMVILGEVRIVRSRLALPLGLLTFSTLLSFIFTPSRLVSLVSLNTWVLIFLPFVYLLYLNIPSNLKDIQKIVGAFLTSATLLSLLALFNQGVDVGLYKIPTGFPLLKVTPAGSMINLNAIQFFTIIVTGILAFHNKKPFTRGLLVTTALIAMLSLFLVNPWSAPQKPLLLGLGDSWGVAVGSFKSNPLLGVGPGKYAEAFQRFKPLSYNTSDNWSVVFGSATITPLQIMTELGLVGTLVLIFVLVATFFLLKDTFLKLLHSPQSPGDIWLQALTGGLMGALLILVFLPLTTTTLFIFILAIALLEKLRFLLLEGSTQEVQIWVLALPIMADQQPTLFNKESPSRAVLAKSVLASTLVLVVIGGYGLSRSYAGEFQYRESLAQVTSGKGTKAYELQQRVINLNPLEARFHIAYANTNMGIANALAQKKEGLTEEDSKNIGQLVNQAVREARRAVTIAPNNSIYWENLGNIYRDLRGVAGGSEQWAITSFTQAINLNPFNPRLRISIGGIYYGMKDWDNAILAFTDAAKLKPDFANAYYNLAWAYRQKGDHIRALQAMQKTLELTGQENENALKVQTELEEFQRLATQQQQKMAQDSQNQGVLGEQVQQEVTPSANPEVPTNSYLKPQEESSKTPAVSVGD